MNHNTYFGNRECFSRVVNLLCAARTPLSFFLCTVKEFRINIHYLLLPSVSPPFFGPTTNDVPKGSSIDQSSHSISFFVPW